MSDSDVVVLGNSSDGEEEKSDDGAIAKSKRKREDNKEGSAAPPPAAPAAPAAGTQEPPVNECVVCLDEFTSTGEHRVCCLACGHLFGHSCILKALKARKVCPVCNARARLKDVRLLYAPARAVADTHGVEEAVRQADAERRQRLAVEKEKIQLQIQFEMVKSELRALKAERHQSAAAARAAAAAGVPAPHSMSIDARLAAYSSWRHMPLHAWRDGGGFGGGSSSGSGGGGGSSGGSGGAGGGGALWTSGLAAEQAQAAHAYFPYRVALPVTVSSAPLAQGLQHPAAAAAAMPYPGVPYRRMTQHAPAAVPAAAAAAALQPEAAPQRARAPAPVPIAPYPGMADQLSQVASIRSRRAATAPAAATGATSSRAQAFFGVPDWVSRTSPMRSLPAAAAPAAAAAVVAGDTGSPVAAAPNSGGASPLHSVAAAAADADDAAAAAAARAAQRQHGDVSPSPEPPAAAQAEAEATPAEAPTAAAAAGADVAAAAAAAAAAAMHELLAADAAEPAAVSPSPASHALSPWQAAAAAAAAAQAPQYAAADRGAWSIAAAPMLPDPFLHMRAQRGRRRAWEEGLGDSGGAAGGDWAGGSGGGGGAYGGGVGAAGGDAAAAPAPAEVEDALWRVPLTDGRAVTFLESRGGGAYVVATAQLQGPAALPYGVMRVSIEGGARHCQGVRLHAAAVRDVSAAPGGAEQLLTTGFDSRLCIYDAASNRQVLCWNQQRRGWSCSWNDTNPMQVFVGLDNGVIQAYDIRNTRTFCKSLELPAALGRGAVHSLAHVSSGPGGVPELLVGRVGDAQAYLFPLSGGDASTAAAPPRAIALGSPCTSLAACAPSAGGAVFLASHRGPSASHRLFTVAAAAAAAAAAAEPAAAGSQSAAPLEPLTAGCAAYGASSIGGYVHMRALSRACLWDSSGGGGGWGGGWGGGGGGGAGAVLVASGEEQTQRVRVWDARSGALRAVLGPQHASPVLAVRARGGLVASVSAHAVQLVQLPGLA